MQNRTLGFVVMWVMVVGSFLLGLAVSDLRTANQPLTRLTDDELIDSLATDRLCMETGSITGCRMTHAQYGIYHATKRELERRGIAAQ